MTIQEQIRQAAKQELARRDFWQFCLYYDPMFLQRPFLKPVASAFMRIYSGEINSLSVSMPPRAGKSYITSLFCAWMLGKFPTESIMRNTCTATLYEKFSYDVRNVVRSVKFQEVFPDVKLAPDKQSVRGWNLEQSKQVGYFGAGVGGTIIGFGATKLAITDDLYKDMQDAMSDTVNDSVQSWMESSHGSRFEKGCAKIDIGTRWTKKDVIGSNMEKGRYDESIVIRALDSEDKSFCEEVNTTEYYHKKREEITDIVWLAEYQQEPIEAKGLLFPKYELRYFNPNERHEFESALAYSDVADAGDDNTSMPIGRNKKSDIYITDWLFSQDISNITIPLSLQKIKAVKASYWRIEANSMGAMYAREATRQIELDKSMNTEVYTAHSTANKHTRILMDAGFIKKHCVFIHKDYQDKEYKRAYDQLTEYLKNGTSKKDDAPDSMQGLVQFIRGVLPHYYE